MSPARILWRPADRCRRCRKLRSLGARLTLLRCDCRLLRLHHVVSNLSDLGSSYPWLIEQAVCVRTLRPIVRDAKPLHGNQSDPLSASKAHKMRLLGGPVRDSHRCGQRLSLSVMQPRPLAADSYKQQGALIDIDLDVRSRCRNSRIATIACCQMGWVGDNGFNWFLASCGLICFERFTP